jgi:hypothetical protein
MITQELKNKWLAALKSGKYKRGNGILRGEGFHCCLGVLHDITGAEWQPCDDGTFLVEDDPIFAVERLKNLGLDYADARILARENDRAVYADLSYKCVIPLIEALPVK